MCLAEFWLRTGLRVGTGDTPLNLMAGTLGLVARTAGRVSWKTGAHLKRNVHRSRAN